MGAAWSAASDGLVVSVRLTPKGGRDALEGLETLANGRVVLKARVKAPPADNEANAALVKLLARSVTVPPRDVSIVAGASARIKRLKIVGDASTLAARLTQIVKTGTS
ncbi:MAG: DUF167 family protein [Hyphomicrobium sp.]|nr:DUF167 family protein [Hyphomicrobium sp.]